MNYNHNQSPQHHENNWGVAIFLLLFLLIVSSLPESILFLFALMFLGAALRNVDFAQLWDRLRNMSINTWLEEVSNYTSDTYRATRNSSTAPELIYRHALNAVTAAGLDPDEVQVLTVDIGLLVYTGDDKPEVYRTWSIPDDADYIQPFVQLRLPRKATGVIGFEIYDGSGTLIYAREDHHILERGRNFITPSTRAPVHYQYDMTGDWELRVLADGVLLAVHRFMFNDTISAITHNHIGEDGELTSELRLAITDSSATKISLDDLLSSYDDEDSGRTARRA